MTYLRGHGPFSALAGTRRAPWEDEETLRGRVEGGEEEEWGREKGKQRGRVGGRGSRACCLHFSSWAIFLSPPWATASPPYTHLCSTKVCVCGAAVHLPALPS